MKKQTGLSLLNFLLILAAVIACIVLVLPRFSKTHNAAEQSAVENSAVPGNEASESSSEASKEVAPAAAPEAAKEVPPVAAPEASAPAASEAAAPAPSAEEAAK